MLSDMLEPDKRRLLPYPEPTNNECLEAIFEPGFDSGIESLVVNSRPAAALAKQQKKMIPQNLYFNGAHILNIYILA